MKKPSRLKQLKQLPRPPNAITPHDGEHSIVLGKAIVLEKASSLGLRESTAWAKLEVEGQKVAGAGQNERLEDEIVSKTPREDAMLEGTGSGSAPAAAKQSDIAHSHLYKPHEMMDLSQELDVGADATAAYLRREDKEKGWPADEQRKSVLGYVRDCIDGRALREWHSGTLLFSTRRRGHKEETRSKYLVVPVAASLNIPPDSDWEVRQDPACGRTYYQNNVTQHTSWEPPAEALTTGDQSEHCSGFTNVHLLRFFFEQVWQLPRPDVIITVC